MIPATATSSATARLGLHLVVFLGLDGHDDLYQCSEFCAFQAHTEDQFWAVLEEEKPATLVLGPRLTPTKACAILGRRAAEYPQWRSVNIVIYEGSHPEKFQTLVDEDNIFFLSRVSIQTEELRSIIIAANARFQTTLCNGGLATELVRNDTSEEILAFCSELSRQRDLATAFWVLTDGVTRLLGCERAQFLLHDEASQTLWSPQIGNIEASAVSSASGVAGYVLHTGKTVSVGCARKHPCYDADADDPEGTGNERLIASVMRSGSGEALGVVSAVRRPDGSPFTDADVSKLALLATTSAPIFAFLIHQDRLQRALSERSHRNEIHEAFQSDALKAYGKPLWEEEGKMMEVLPTWLNVWHMALAVMMVVLVCYCALARIHEEATGPIWVEARVKTTVAATSQNVVQTIAVAVHDHVSKGDLVLRMGTAVGDKVLDRQKAEYRAPINGVIGNILVRRGQSVGAGDDLFTIVDEQAGHEIVALLPGNYAPQIHKGASIVFKLQGYNEAQESRIEDISAEIVGPQEATRFLGQQSAGALNLSGPVVVVRSILLPESFQTYGQEFGYRDGMTGTGEVSMSSERLIIKLVPGLHDLVRRPGNLLNVK